MSDFIHLHSHGYTSLIDGATRPSEAADMAEAMGMDTYALTDHGTLGGFPETYRACKEKGVLCIPGSEFYIVPDTQAVGWLKRGGWEKGGTQRDSRNFHLTLLAKNEQGYKDLVKLTSWAHDPVNFYHNPRIDHKMLRQIDTSNIVCMSGCVMGELQETFLHYMEPHVVATRDIQTGRPLTYNAPYLVPENDIHLRRGLEAARQVMKLYRSLFPEGQYFYECMWHEFEPEGWAHMYLVPEAKKYGLKVVGTQDAHYGPYKDGAFHDLLMYLQWQGWKSGKFCSEPGNKQLDLCDGDTFRDRLSGLLHKEDVDEAMNSTLEIAEMCSGFTFTPMSRKTFHIPRARIETPDGKIEVVEKPYALLRELAEPRLAALCERYPKKAKKYRARFEYEFSVMRGFKRMAHYFATVALFCKAAQENGVKKGAGRGSGAGSLVAYTTGITDIDPIKYRLRFERFLNPARLSLPDFDTDFQHDKADWVFEYLERIYGIDNVARVGTYGRYTPKSIVTDLLKALTDLSHQDIKDITKDLPGDTLDRSDEAFMDQWWQNLESEKLKEIVTKSPWPIEEWSKKLYGLRKNIGTHAAGATITENNLSIKDWVPRQITSSKKSVTQFDMDALGLLGLVKYDILRLKTLTIIDEIEKLIGGSPFTEFDEMNDKATFDLINAGRTEGVFQLTGYAARSVVQQIGGCHDFEDIVAVMALGRPGAIKFSDDYRRNRENPEGVEYPHPLLKKDMAGSHGIILYQEDVMNIAYTLGLDDEWVGDMLDALKKYSPTKFDKLWPRFKKSARRKGLSVAQVKDVWERFRAYTGYGFNRSHAVCYAQTAYQMAFLKANYPAEFLTVNLRYAETEDREPLVRDARYFGVKMRRPHVNKSQVTFSIDKDGAIRFGLADVKGIGVKAANEILRHRPFTEDDYVEAYRTPRGRLVKQQLLRVTKSSCNQGHIDALAQLGAIPGCEATDVWEAEEELLKCHVTEYHDMAKLRAVKKRITAKPNMRVLQTKKPVEGLHARVGGVVQRIHEHPTKRGKMAFVDLALGKQDFSLMIWADDWRPIRKKVKKGRLIEADVELSWHKKKGKGYILKSVETHR